MRRLLVLASTMVFFDVVFFAAIAPLLPDYVDQFDLSKVEAGILTASYAAGTLLASLPAGLLANRLGPRRTVICGLLVLGVASLAFGFVEQILLLDAARFCQGVAGALIWSGALTWLIKAAPSAKRGSVIGTALGAAVAGALVGPALGALAAEVGTEPVFGAVFGVAFVLAALAARMPEAPQSEHQGLREVAATIASRPILAATSFVAIPSVMFGATEVLLPLRIDELGGGHALIAGGFIAGAGLEASLAPISGRYSDRAGRRRPLVAGFLICAIAMSLVALGQTLGVVMVSLIATSLGAGACFAPALAMLSEAAEARNLDQGYAAGLSNIAWASGQVVGGVAGAGGGRARGYATPRFGNVLLLLVTAAYAFRALGPATARPAEA